MTNAHQGTVDIPYQYVNRVEGMNASIEPEGCDTEVYGVSCPWYDNSHIAYTPANGRKQCVLTAQVRITDCRYKIIKGMTGTASILVSNASVLQRILQRITSII